MFHRLTELLRSIFKQPQTALAAPMGGQNIAEENVILQVRITQLQEANALSQKELEELRAERAVRADITRGLIRLCRVAYTIMSRKRSKKGVTREAAAEWMEDFESITALHFKEITNMDAE